jgi:CRP/FNR family transcriptional regulator, cyclic AMP receptor protein
MERIGRRRDERNVDFRIFKDVNSFVVSFSAGGEILGPGKISNVMYIIQKGVVAVQIEGATVAQLTEGNIFGEMGIVDPRPHTASIFAVTDVELFVVDEAQFLTLIAKTPMFALRVMRVLASRLRSMNSRLLGSFHGTA